MGDGFLDTDIVNGTYDEVMNKAMENLFTEEPLKSLQSYFNVYSVMAVSAVTNLTVTTRLSNAKWKEE